MQVKKYEIFIILSQKYYLCALILSLIPFSVAT